MSAELCRGRIAGNVVAAAEQARRQAVMSLAAIFKHVAVAIANILLRKIFAWWQY